MKLYEVVRGGQTFTIQGDDRTAKRFGAKLVEPAKPAVRRGRPPKEKVAE